MAAATRARARSGCVTPTGCRGLPAGVATRDDIYLIDPLGNLVLRYPPMTSDPQAASRRTSSAPAEDTRRDRLKRGGACKIHDLTGPTHSRSTIAMQPATVAPSVFAPAIPRADQAARRFA